MTRSAVVVESVVRMGVTVAILLLAVPIGWFLGVGTVSAFTQGFVSGVLVLFGSLAVVALIGLGLYIVAEGAVPAPLRQYVSSSFPR
ncbi:hypothetical protein HALLA_17010 [Halostagnicola larsenii XH-48]|uniref:Transporter n=1 Tax=Halostagnicola larsenii XH-48 TaxID=797299 RepID=W0JR76_9EURY|nr:hypothetical protein [Halostagnicola larsenii]AHG01114.1 hypothetical protein HALLA_17010 [Halostagnicola larsenii XH-48]